MALDYKSSLGRYRRYLQTVTSQPLWGASLWVMLSLILLIILVFLALRPTLITIADLVGKIEQKNTVTKQLEARILAVSYATALLETERDRLPLLNEALPKEAEWNTLAETLSGLATSSGVTLVNVTVSEPTGSKTEQPVVSFLPTGVLPLRFSVTAEGEIENFKQFVNSMEKKRRILMVSTIRIETTKTGNYRMIIQGEASYLPDKLNI